jgi:hypothetical protein
LKANDIMRVISKLEPDPELENRLKNRIINSSANADRVFTLSKRKSLFRKSAVALAAVFCIVFISIFGIPTINNQISKQGLLSTQAAFKGFAITAYASDGKAVKIVPNVKVSYDQYELTMSKYPGIPIKISCSNADSIHVTANGGTFLSWQEPAGKVTTLGSNITVKPDSKIYWSPISDNQVVNQAVINRTVTVSIVALKGGKEYGSTSFDIECGYKKTDIAEATWFFIKNKQPDEAYKLQK